MGYKNREDALAAGKRRYQKNKKAVSAANRGNPEHIRRATEWNAKHPEERKAFHRKAVCRHHGITVARYDEQVAHQQGVCAICLQPEPVKGQALAIDHDHLHCPGPYGCNKCFRGLLCSRCNPGLGYFKDDRWRLTRAIEYITKGNSNVDI